MNDFRIMARILAAVKQCEKDQGMDVALFDPRVLKTDEKSRDALIVKLQREGYVDGFFLVEDKDSQPYPVVMLGVSNPQITIKGMTFIEENKPLKKAIEELKDAVVSVASNKLTNGLFML